MSDTPPKDLAFPAPLGSAGKAPPPPKTDTAPKRSPGRPPAAARLTTLQRGLEANFTAIGMAVFAFNQFDGEAILNGSEDLAKALVNLADRNPKVRAALERMLTGASYTELLLAAGAIALPIAGNHGMIPGPLGKVYKPKQEPEESQ